MSQDLNQYIQHARSSGLSDDEIKRRMVSAGWDQAVVESALGIGDDLTPPPPPPAASSQAGNPNQVNVLSGGFSNTGFEYMIYFIAMGVVALSVGSLLHNIINTLVTTEKFEFYQEVIPVAAAALLVAAPIYLALMVRLGKKEAQQPAILRDPSRNRAVQLLLFITFIVGIIKLVAYVYNMLNAGFSSAETSLLAETLHAMVTIGITGGIFWKYFRESK